MLEQELEALLRQRDQYTLALDAATDPQASIRLQRTLDRLDDEIAGLQEALTALPAEPVAASVPPPDWEDEPATAIFDPDVMPAPPPPRRAVDPDELTPPVGTLPSAPERDPAPKPSEEVTDPARPLYDIEAEMRREIDLAASLRPRVVAFAPNAAKRAPSPEPPPPPEPAPEPGAAEPLPAVDPTINVTPPLDSFGADAPTVMWHSPPKLVRATGAKADPLGPVVLDALEPPTGENPREDDEPPSDPFAVAGARWGAPADHPFGPTYTPTLDDASPFGSTAVGGAAFDAMSVEVAPEPEWSAGSKIALALAVLGFLAGVGWVLTQ